MNGIQYILRQGTWDNECVRIWKEFTKVDSSIFLGTDYSRVLSICFTYDKVTKCLDNIEEYTKTKLEQIKYTQPSDIYGDHNMYDSKSIVLTNNEMQSKLSEVLQDIKRMKLA